MSDMASPAKIPRQELVTVSGFIHCVSAIKFSAKCKEFFNAVLQTGREEFHDVVVFSPSKRNKFLLSAQNGTPLCLKNIKKAISFRGTSDFDVIVNNRSDVSVTTVLFNKRTPSTRPKTSLQEISEMQVGRMVSLVEAKVISISPSTRTVKVRGAPREVRSFRISDGTAQMTLQLWEKQINAVQALSSYAITQLSTRSFEGKILLTTTVGTSFSNIDDLNVPDAAAESADAGLTSITGPVVALEIRATMNCSLCGRLQEMFEQTNKFHRCQKCRMMQRTGTYNRMLSGTIKMTGNGEVYTLCVSNLSLLTYMHRYNLQNLDRAEELEEHFLGQTSVCVSFDKELRISEITQTEDTVPYSPE